MGKFDNHLFRVSSLPHIMPGLVSGKANYESAKAREIELYAKYQKKLSEYDAIVNKETSTAKKAEAQRDKYLDDWVAQKAATSQAKLQENSVFISEGCKTHLLDVYIAREFNRTTKDLKNKYIEKGIQMEDTGILSYSVVKGRLFEKNNERKDDGFIMGERDFDDNDIVCDNKCSWDIWTFYRNIKFIENPRSCPYYPNSQGYMKIFKRQKSRVVYTLIDTPEKLIEQEKKYFTYSFVGNEELLQEGLAEIEKNLKYSDIPIDRRIIEIPINRDEEYIENIEKCVIACREYLNNIKEKYYEMD